MFDKRKAMRITTILYMAVLSVGLAACQPGSPDVDSTPTPPAVETPGTTPIPLSPDTDLATSGDEVDASASNPTATPPTVETPDNDMPEAVSDEDAKEILRVLLPRAEAMHASTFNGESPNMDRKQPMPGDERFVLLTGGEYKSMADLKEAVESIFTKEIAESVFYARYIDEDDGVSNPLYKEYEGQLYQNTRNGGRGWAFVWLIETAVVQSLEGNQVAVQMDVTLFDEPSEPLTVVLEYVNGQWRIANQLG